MLSMLLTVFGNADPTARQEYEVRDLYEKALDIMITRVELKRLSDRLRVREGVEQTLRLLQEIAYARHLGKARDFTLEEAISWAGEDAAAWQALVAQIDQGRFPVVATFLEGDGKRLYRFSHLSFQESPGSQRAQLLGVANRVCDQFHRSATYRSEVSVRAEAAYCW